MPFGDDPARSRQRWGRLATFFETESREEIAGEIGYVETERYVETELLREMREKSARLRDLEAAVQALRP